jgi:hypothetical protein
MGFLEKSSRHPIRIALSEGQPHKMNPGDAGSGSRHFRALGSGAKSPRRTLSERVEVVMEG